MLPNPRVPLIRAVILGAVGLAIAGSVKAYLSRDNKPDAASYVLRYSHPTGWVEQRFHPGAIFIFHDPDHHVSLRAGMLSLLEDYNPNPEQDTDWVANDYLKLTADNMPGWEGQLLDNVDAKNCRFRLLKRSDAKHYMYTAVCVRGNTTISVSLLADGNHREEVDANVDWFKKYLATLSLEPEFSAAPSKWPPSRSPQTRGS